MTPVRLDVEEVPAGMAGDAASWRHIYVEFMTTVSHDPTLSAAVALSESLTGCPTVITDGDGAVLTSSPGYTGGARIEPPPVSDVLHRKKWTDSSGVATPITAPGRWFVWLLDGADATDPVHRAALRITTELTQLLKTVVLPGIPPNWLAKGHLAERIIRGDDAEHVRSEAARLGYDIDQRSHAVVIAPPPIIQAQQLAMIIGPRIRHFGPMTTRSGRVVIVAFGDRDLENLLDALIGITDVDHFVVGVGGSRPDGTDMHRSYEQAVAVTARSAPGDDFIRRFDEQDPIDIFGDLADPETVDLLISRSLGPLLDYDHAHRHELLVTLCRWLDWTGSLDTLAENLHIHKSTLTYRIRRIKELLDDDLADGRKRFELGLSLRLLGHRETVGGGHSVAAE